MYNQLEDKQKKNGKSREDNEEESLRENEASRVPLHHCTFFTNDTPPWTASTSLSSYQGHNALVTCVGDIYIICCVISIINFVT